MTKLSLRVGIYMLYALGSLPRPMALCIARSIGVVLYYLPLKRNHIARKNIDLCFKHMKESERAKLCLQNAKASGQALADMAAAWFWSDTRIKQEIRHEVRGLDALYSLQAKHEGVLILARHCVHLELDHRVASLYVHGYGVGRHHNDPQLARLIYQGRRKSAEEIADKKSPMQFIRWLKEGKTVLYLPDQDYGMQGSEVVDFFGVPTATTMAPARIVKMTSAHVFALDSFWQGDQLIITLTPCTFDKEDYATFTQQMSAWVEMSVARQPQTYLWQHRRFKSTLGKAFYRA